MKLKQALTGALALAMAVTSTVNVTAYDIGVMAEADGISVEAEINDAGTFGDFEYEILEDGTNAITKYTGSDTNINIPWDIGGNPVTAIGDRAFYNNTAIVSVEIPDSVTSIGWMAFTYCSALTSVEIPDSVTEIGSYAFSGCKALEEVKLSDSLTSINSYAFNGCTALPEIEFPASVTSIAYSAFDGCSSLAGVEIPETLTSIGDNAFRATAIGEIDIHAGVTWIGSLAFSKCLSLTDINVSEDNKRYSSVDGVLFNKDITTLTCYPAGKENTAYVIPDGVTYISSNAFDSCVNLASVEVSDSVTSIGSNAFAGCESLASVKLSDSITSLDWYAFFNCTSLTSINIPDSVTRIGSGAFCGCTSLSAINVSENNKYYTSVDGVLFDKDITEIICYPAGKKDTAYAIPDSVTYVPSYAFNDCIFLEMIDIPAGVISFGWAVFSGCTALTAINVSEDNQYLASIDGVLFNKDITTLGCYPAGKEATTYVIPDSVTLIDWNAFDYCIYLTAIAIPDSVTEIYGEAFNNCTSLAMVEIPDSVTYIAWGVFDNCADNLTIFGYDDSYAEAYAGDNGIPFVAIDNTAEDKTTGVKIQFGEGTVPATAEVSVTEIDSDSDSITYDITLIDGEEKIRPKGEVVVKFPVPEGWDTYKIYVYYIDENGDLTDMNAVVYGGCIVFTTDHFSKYIITAEKQIDTVIGGSGDVNGNGEVNDLDVVALARYLANWNVTIDEAAADVNGDGVVNDLDVVMLARRLAGWNV